MDFWISKKEVKTGPFSLQQLHVMWNSGELTADSYYYDPVHSQWLLLRQLIENNRQIFTIEEAFVRVGQCRQTGCLLVYSDTDVIHLFVNEGYVVAAHGTNEYGEMAVARALDLDNSTFEWFIDAKPPESPLHISIQEYALKHAIANDVRFAKPSKHTQSLKMNGDLKPTEKLADKPPAKARYDFVLVPDATPTVSFRLLKPTNVLGREDFCDLVIKANQISRKHCLLEVVDGHVEVKDLDSSNGTFINGSPVKGGRLNANEKISLGNYAMTLKKEAKRAPELTA